MSELVENFDDGNHVIVDNENLLNENNDVDNDDHNES